MFHLFTVPEFPSEHITTLLELAREKRLLSLEGWRAWVHLVAWSLDWFAEQESNPVIGNSITEEAERHELLTALYDELEVAPPSGGTLVDVHKTRLGLLLYQLADLYEDDQVAEAIYDQVTEWQKEKA